MEQGLSCAGTRAATRIEKTCVLGWRPEGPVPSLEREELGTRECRVLVRLLVATVDHRVFLTTLVVQAGPAAALVPAKHYGCGGGRTRILGP